MYSLASGGTTVDTVNRAGEPARSPRQIEPDAVLEPRVCWIIGATSGVGAASALALASSSRHLVLSGRRPEYLADVVDSVRARGGSADMLPVDISDSAAFDAALDNSPGLLSNVTELLFCAGINVRRRQWADLLIDELQAVISTNLTAAAQGIARTLRSMVTRGYGRLIIVSSWAGWTYSRGAGVAYSASKAALKSLTESVNDQHGNDGISACLLCPGDIDTPFVLQRPVVPTREQRARMLAAEDVAHVVRLVFDMPPQVAVNELVMSPIHSHAYGR